MTCPGGMHKTDALLGTQLSQAMVRRLTESHSRSSRMSTVTIVCIALMGVLLFLLGANVSRNRAITGKNGGNQLPTDPADRLMIAIRAHGNAAEYIPTMIVLVLVCSALSDSWWVDVLAVAALTVRTMHAVGMLTAKTLAAHGPLRDIAAMGTYLVGITLGITAIAAI